MHPAFHLGAVYSFRIHKFKVATLVFLYKGSSLPFFWIMDSSILENSIQVFNDQLTYEWMIGEAMIGQNLMFTHTPSTLPSEAILSQLPQERLLNNLELVHTPDTSTSDMSSSNSHFSFDPAWMQSPLSTSLQQEFVMADTHGHAVLLMQNTMDFTQTGDSDPICFSTLDDLYSLDLEDMNISNVEDYLHDYVPAVSPETASVRETFNPNQKLSTMSCEVPSVSPLQSLIRFVEQFDPSDSAVPFTVRNNSTQKVQAPGLHTLTLPNNLNMVQTPPQMKKKIKKATRRQPQPKRFQQKKQQLSLSTRQGMLLSNTVVPNVTLQHSASRTEAQLSPRDNVQQTAPPQSHSRLSYRPILPKIQSPPVFLIIAKSSLQDLAVKLFGTISNKIVISHFLRLLFHTFISMQLCKSVFSKY